MDSKTGVGSHYLVKMNIKEEHNIHFIGLSVVFIVRYHILLGHFIVKTKTIKKNYRQTHKIDNILFANVIKGIFLTKYQ